MVAQDAFPTKQHIDKITTTKVINFFVAFSFYIKSVLHIFYLVLQVTCQAN
jgi:hypothetical protein